MVLSSYSALRFHFARVARTTGVSLTYDDALHKITRGAGSFITDGFTVGMSVDVSGTTSNDGRYTITNVAALALTVSEDLTLEIATSSLTGAEYDPDGAEKWPTDLVRAAGFSSTFTLLPPRITQFPVELTCNALVSDVTAGTSYRWYLRQRTDDTALQWISIVHANPLYTGTVGLFLTSKAVSDMGLALSTSKLTAEQQVRTLRNVTVFCRRDSDGAIQLVDLLQLSHGAVS